jgi:hypothetical protein
MATLSAMIVSSGIKVCCNGRSLSAMVDRSMLCLWLQVFKKPKLTVL